MGRKLHLAADQVGGGTHHAACRQDLQLSPAVHLFEERAQTLLRPAPPIWAAAIREADAVCREEQGSTRPQDSPRLFERFQRSGDELQDTDAQYAVELSILEGQGIGGSDDVDSRALEHVDA